MGDDFDWIVTSGLTPSRTTGPSTDHTLMNGDGKLPWQSLFKFHEIRNGFFFKKLRIDWNDDSSLTIAVARYPAKCMEESRF